MQNVLVLIPTYNEADNIKSLITTILNLDTSRLKAKLDVLVVDDESPDGTLNHVKNLKQNPKYKHRIHFRTGTKQGLGKAMFRGFDHFLEEFEHQILVTMDADFSHDPKQIPDLLDAIINRQADVAVGSRYVDGGLIPGTWPLSLIIRTRVAAAVAHWLGGIDDTLHELTTNFRAITRKVLEEMPYHSFDARGYGFHLYMVNHFIQNKLHLIEVPISFHSRHRGHSKSQIKDVLEFFRIAHNLNLDSPAKQIFRFMVIGASGVIVNLGALYILSLSLPDTGAGWLSISAIQISIVWNFFWHTKYTFRSSRLHNNRYFSWQTISEFFKYELAASMTQFLTLTVFLTLNSAGIYFLLAQFAGIVFAFIFNYYISRKYIWSFSRAQL